LGETKARELTNFVSLGATLCHWTQLLKFHLEGFQGSQRWPLEWPVERQALGKLALGETLYY